MSAEDHATIIVRARDGDEDSLQQLRVWLGPDPSRQNPHTFTVAPQGVLVDALAPGPQRRNEVFAKIPPFRNARNGPGATSWSMSAVAACPPLEKFCMQQAMAHMEAIETRLITQESLSRADRARLRRELTLLGAQGRTFWENWVWYTPAPAHVQFDRLVNEWMSGAIDMNEAHWFKPGWDERPYGIEAANTFFRKMPAEIRTFFDIELAELQRNGLRETDCIVLKSSPQEANRWAKLLKVKFRFNAG
jgi:hypothetical protein